MMFTPFEPKAGPTGGEGLAAPPLICNLMIPATSLAIIIVYELIDLKMIPKLNVGSNLVFGTYIIIA